MKKGFRIIKFKKDKPVFQIKNISKSYEGRPILKKICMDLHPGECVGLLGPNGSGKSTLYSTIIGEIYADAGKIILNGKEIIKGDNIIIPIAIKILATTKSIIKKGINKIKPI